MLHSIGIRHLVEHHGQCVRSFAATHPCSTCSILQALVDAAAGCFTARQRCQSTYRWVARAARGISDEPVVGKSVPKSMLAAKSFTATSDWAELQRWVRVLAEELASRMATDSARHNRRPRNIVVSFRCAGGAKGPGTSRSRCAPNSANGSCPRRMGRISGCGCPAPERCAVTACEARHTKHGVPL